MTYHNFSDIFQGLAFHMNRYKSATARHLFVNMKTNKEMQIRQLEVLIQQWLVQMQL